jgi:serine/threonine-protein kinase
MATTGEAGRRVGRYRLLRPLGAGGAAEVWEAEASGGDRAPVALKIVRLAPADASGAGPAPARRFAAEAAILASLRHPNIVGVLEGGVDAERGEAYLAMELLRGQTLAALAAGRALPVGLVAALGRDLAAALDHAHGARGADGRPLSLVHRDVKPSNLFVTVDGTLKLIDFGIALARDLDRTATRTGAIRGSFPYLSPEQARGEPLDARSDLFSAGLVLHELLTGRRVFPQDNEVAILNAVVSARVSPVTAVRPEIPAALGALVGRMLVRDRDGRVATAAEVAAGLEGAVPAADVWTRADVGRWVERQALASGAGAPATRTADAAIARAETPAPADGAAPGRAPTAERPRRPGAGPRPALRAAGLLLALGAATLLVGFGVSASRGRSGRADRSTPPDAQPSFPVRATFYYLPHIEAEPPGVYPASRFQPTLAGERLSVRALVDRHVEGMLHGRIDVGIASWRGVGARSDEIVPTLLDAAARTPLRWTLYHEAEGREDPDPGRIRADLAHIAERYARHPAFYRVGGRFALFVYSDLQDECGMVKRWREANTFGAYLVLKAFPGHESCPEQPDGWHSYRERRMDQVGSWSATICPGVWHVDRPVALARDLERWRRDVRWLQATGARFQIVVSYNEWRSGTSVEGAREWTSPSGFGAYLDVLREETPARGSSARAAAGP